MSSQEKFLKGINQKESDAWKELYRYFYGTLCNYTTKIVVDETVAEDIVQECFISIWNSSLHFQEMKALSVYLYRSVHNNALKYLRDKNVDGAKNKTMLKMLISTKPSKKSLSANYTWSLINYRNNVKTSCY